MRYILWNTDPDPDLYIRITDPHTGRGKPGSRSASDLPDSAVHVDLDASDIRSILGRKKHYRGRHFLRLPEALHWYFRKDLLRKFIDAFL
jgi:hypothetical protein